MSIFALSVCTLIESSLSLRDMDVYFNLCDMTVYFNLARVLLGSIFFRVICRIDPVSSSHSLIVSDFSVFASSCVFRACWLVS